MRNCRNCNKPFEPEAFEVFCSVDCTADGNSKPKELSAKTAAGGGFVVGIVKESPGWSESEFQEMVCKRAAELGWKWYHVRDSRKTRRGWPDLVLWRDRIVYMELKDATGQATADQLTMHEELKAAGGEVYLLRPSDWAEIERILT